MNSSIIIPAFNAEKTIEKTINSLLNQSIKPAEIIVVNDGSTDLTQKILEKIAVKNTTIKLFNRNNSGISASRNFGAKKALGETIVFLDSDVVVEKNWLEKMLALLKENVFCVSGKYSVELNGSLSSDFFAFVVGSSSFQGYNIALNKKDFLEFNGFNEKMKYCEDPEFFLRAFFLKKQLVKSDAESFHRSYSLNERIKSNFNYSFFDAVLFKKNFSFLANPFNLLKLSDNLKFIFGFYWILFISVIFSIVSFIVSKDLISFAFLFLPAFAGTTKILLNKNKIKYKNNFVFVLVYSFTALLLFSLVKFIGFFNGLIQGKI